MQKTELQPEYVLRIERSNMSFKQKSCLLAITLAISAVGSANAEVISPTERRPPVAYTCRNMAGSYMGPATGWKPEADASTNQKVQLMINRDGTPSMALWFDKTNEPYWAAEGIAMDVPGGFTFLAVSEQNIETYTLLVSSYELMHTTIRIGGSILPNAIKGQRGTCNPGLD